MTDDQDPGHDARAEEDEPFLDQRMIRVVEQQGIVIGEDRGGLFERHAVLASIRGVFPLVPFEGQSAHGHLVYLRRMYLSQSHTCA